MPRALTAAEVARGFDLLADPKAWRKEARKTYRKVGTIGAKYARAELRGGDRQMVAAARAIRGTSTAQSAAVAVARTAQAPQAGAATWGTKGRTGWYAAPQYAGGRPNNPPWVGNRWRPAVAGEGPRGINDALAKHLPEITQAFADQVAALAARAFRH